MPTEAKRQAVSDLADRIGRATIAIATNFAGLKGAELTQLRRRLREQDVEYRVVKNRLAALAATEAGVEAFRELLEGSTGIVFGYGEPASVAKALDEHVRQTRSALQVRKGLMDRTVLTGAQIAALAALPPRDQLVARLLSQMNAPITGLVNVLSGPLRALATVLERRSEQLAHAE